MAIQILVKTVEARMRDTRDAYRRKCGTKTDYDKIINPLKAMIQRQMGTSNQGAYEAGMFLRGLMKGANKLTGTKAPAFTAAIYELLEERADATHKPQDIQAPDLVEDAVNAMKEPHKDE